MVTCNDCWYLTKDDLCEKGYPYLGPGYANYADICPNVADIYKVVIYGNLQTV